MKKHLWSAAALLCALGAIAFAVLFVITLLPAGVDGVRVDEPVRVSASAIDAAGGRYLVQVRGSLVNERDEPITPEAITLTVSDGKTVREVELKAATLESRFPLYLTDSWEDTVAYDRVDALRITVEGREVRLENREDTVIGTDTVVCLALAAVLTLAAVAIGKQRYYMYQEEKMK